MRTTVSCGRVRQRRTDDRWRQRGPWAALFAALAIIGTAVAPAEGQAAACCLYWSTGFNGTVGRAPLTGFYPRWNWTPATPSGTFGLAADGEHLYWGGQGSIGRAGLDGSDRAPGFITGLADSRQSSLAVDSEHLYWVEPTNDSIGRAKLDGTGVDERFIETAFPASVAVDDAHVYWSGVGGAIGRANVDGTGVEENFITGANLPGAVAVDAGHVYWTNFGADTIGRANLDGFDLDQSWIAPASDPLGLAVDDAHVYWTGPLSGQVGRANLDGSQIDQEFMTKVGAFEIALGPPGPIGDVKAKRTQRQHGHPTRVRLKVSARQRLIARARGTLTVRLGKRGSYQLEQLPPNTFFVRPGETRILRLKPHGKRNRRAVTDALEAGRKATAELSVRLSDQAGNQEFEKLTLRLAA